jgi:hypothetical protein
MTTCDSVAFVINVRALVERDLILLVLFRLAFDAVVVTMSEILFVWKVNRKGEKRLFVINLSVY